MSSPPRVTAERPERVELVTRWEAARESMLVVVATRPDVHVGMAESVRYLYEHFRELPREPLERLDLLLVGAGLPSEVGARLVALLREYTRELGVVITGAVGPGETLAALSGDAVLMHPMATFTTIIPRSAQGGGAGLDSFVTRLMANEDAPYRGLLEATDASAVGDALHRLEWVRHQLDRLCSSRLVPPDTAARDELFDALTRRAARVGEPIARRDARELDGLPVTLPTPDLESLAFDLHIAYEQALRLLTVSDPAAPRAIVESRAMLHTLEPATEDAQDASRWNRHFDSAVH